MIFVSLTEILDTAQGLLQQYYPVKYHWLLFWGFITGVIIAKLLDIFIPDHVEKQDFVEESSATEDERSKSRHKIKRAGLLTAIAIAIHNFPEGLGTFLVSSQNIALGASVAIAIALHNIPEGIAVALICHKRQFFYCHGTDEGLILIFEQYD